MSGAVSRDEFFGYWSMVLSGADDTEVVATLASPPPLAPTLARARS